MLNWKQWLLGTGESPSLVQQYQQVWKVSPIRTGCADPRQTKNPMRELGSLRHPTALASAFTNESQS